ncbi:MAG: tetratricopeptide repeat protein [Anaerolineae bacterium]|nr:tetratricopeptide repeat protein [Anaerolineae bacterium]
MAKKCFVISPIGDEGSPVREEADTLLDLVITPALEPVGFEVIRVDRLKGAKAITNEIIQLIQDSELCIIVLTGHNPNVYYEMGRRHETGKPYIHLIRKGDPIPFDVAPIRTIMYDDISQARVAHAVQKEIVSFVREIEESSDAPYGRRGTGVSLATLAAAIDRIERKLSQVATPSIAGADQPDDDLLGNPYERFQRALDRGDLRVMVALLPRLEMVFGPSPKLLSSAAVVAQAGVEVGVDVVYRLLNDNLTAFTDVEDIIFATASMVDYYGMVDREEEAIPKIEPLIGKILELDQIKASAEIQAWFLNQLAKLYFGKGDFAAAIQIGERVLKLVPDDPSYIVNLSIDYEMDGRIADAIDMVDKLMQTDTQNPAHLNQAVDVYVKAGRRDEARLAYDRLRQIDPDRAKRALQYGDNAKVLLSQ